MQSLTGNHRITLKRKTKTGATLAMGAGYASRELLPFVGLLNKIAAATDAITE